MTPQPVTTAMVLAAGYGTRMRPLTDNRPKPLIEVAGKALIDYTLDQLAEAGISKAVVNVHYLAEQLIDHLQLRDHPAIRISDERDILLETGGGILKALPQLEAPHFFACNTDAILVAEKDENPLRRMMDYFDPASMDALLLVCPLAHATGYQGKGDFSVSYADECGRLVWGEKAAPDEPVYIYTGYQILSSELIKGKVGEKFSARQFWDQAMARGRAFGLVHMGRWMHVGDPDGLRIAENFLSD